MNGRILGSSAPISMKFCRNIFKSMYFKNKQYKFFWFFEPEKGKTYNPLSQISYFRKNLWEHTTLSPPKKGYF